MGPDIDRFIMEPEESAESTWPSLEIYTVSVKKVFVIDSVIIVLRADKPLRGLPKNSSETRSLSRRFI